MRVKQDSKLELLEPNAGMSAMSVVEAVQEQSFGSRRWTNQTLCC